MRRILNERDDTMLTESQRFQFAQLAAGIAQSVFTRTVREDAVLREIQLHLHPHNGSRCPLPDCGPIGPHTHCADCHGVLLSGEQVARFGKNARTSSWGRRKGTPKYYCLDCGRRLSDSTVRAEVAA